MIKFKVKNQKAFGYKTGGFLHYTDLFWPVVLRLDIGLIYRKSRQRLLLRWKGIPALCL